MAPRSRTSPRSSPSGTTRRHRRWREHIREASESDVDRWKGGGRMKGRIHELVLALALGLALPASGFAQEHSSEHPKEHPKEHPAEHPKGSGAGVTKEDLGSAVETYIRGEMANGGGAWKVEDKDEGATLQLTLDKVHKDKLAATAKDPYFACADLKNADGHMYDL